MNKLLCVGVLAGSLAGCAGSPAWTSMQISSTRETAQKNNANLMTVEIGQSRGELLKIMGTPDNREAYQLPHKRIVEFLFYRTEGWSRYQQMDTDSQFTPVAIRNGKVSGWGRNYYDRVVRAAVDVTVK